MLYSVVRQLRRRHGHPPLGAGLRRLRLPALLAVLGPGLLAGLSDDDPAGITTYSIAGARYGYTLLWVLLLSVCGAGRLPRARRPTRARDGARPGLAHPLVVWQPTAAAAGRNARGREPGHDLRRVRGRRRRARAGGGQPLSLRPGRRGAGGIRLVLRGSFHRMSMCSCCSRRCSSPTSARPSWRVRTGPRPAADWSPRRSPTPWSADRHHRDRRNTLAPWGLAFIQSYAADKRLKRADFSFERIDVISGAALTGIIGAFVLIACAATLHETGHREIDRRTRCRSRPRALAGHLASTLFAAGLVGAALLAAAVVPLRPPIRSRSGSAANAGSTIPLPRRHSSISPISASRPGRRVRPHPRPAADPGALPDPGAERGAPVAAARRVAHARAGQALAGRLRDGRGGDLLALFALALVALSIAGLAASGLAR